MADQNTRPTPSSDVADSLRQAWSDFCDNNPDDLTSPEDLPDHALMTCDQFVQYATHALARFSTPAQVEMDWRDDPAADERWDAGLEYALEQLCIFLGVDQSQVTWDAATETVDGDVHAVIGNILRVKFGEDWGPNIVDTPAQVVVTGAMVEAGGVALNEHCTVYRDGSYTVGSGAVRAILEAALSATDGKPIAALRSECAASGRHEHDGCSCSDDELRKPTDAKPVMPAEPAAELSGLSLAVANRLAEAFGGDDTDMSLAFMRNGHSGPGFYSWLTEYPQDGCEFLGPVSEHSYLHFALAQEGKSRG
jgi:hypothetical protein